MHGNQHRLWRRRSIDGEISGSNCALRVTGLKGFGFNCAGANDRKRAAVGQRTDSRIRTIGCVMNCRAGRCARQDHGHRVGERPATRRNRRRRHHRCRGDDDEIRDSDAAGSRAGLERLGFDSAGAGDGKRAIVGRRTDCRIVAICCVPDRRTGSGAIQGHGHRVGERTASRRNHRRCHGIYRHNNYKRSGSASAVRVTSLDGPGFDCTGAGDRKWTAVDGRIGRRVGAIGGVVNRRTRSAGTQRHSHGVGKCTAGG